MKAILFHYSLPRFAFAYLLGAVTPRAYLAAPSPLAMEERGPQVLRSTVLIVFPTDAGRSVTSAPLRF